MRAPGMQSSVLACIYAMNVARPNECSCLPVPIGHWVLLRRAKGESDADRVEIEGGLYGFLRAVELFRASLVRADPSDLRE